MASGPKAPWVETVSGMRRMRGGSAPYSVPTQCEAMDVWAAERLVSVCWEATWVAPAASKVLTSRSV